MNGARRACGRLTLVGTVTCAAVACLAPSAAVLAGDCEAQWVPTFGGIPGADGSVRALAVFDDGSGGGPAVYVGGNYVTAGGITANRIARWEDSTWSSLGGGISGVDVLALAVFDDGSGEALYVGGWFNSVGGVSSPAIARWDGESWSSLAGGMGGVIGAPVVRALAVYDDGFGPALYAGGSFASAGGVPAFHIAKWDGETWSPVGSGMSPTQPSEVYALEVFDDGTGNGPALYAGGDFLRAGGVLANNIAKWDGASWSSVNTGMGSGGTFNPPVVFTLCTFDDALGGGLALYAGGQFLTAGGVDVNRIAKWDGASWTALGTGVNGQVWSLSVFDDGNSSALYAGGNFTAAGSIGIDRLAKWDGASWSPVGTGMNSTVRALAVLQADSDGGPYLLAGGDFSNAGGQIVRRVARWDGSTFTPLLAGSAIPANNEVAALAVFDSDVETGNRSRLIAGGRFTDAGGVAVNRIAGWDGSSWSPLGSGLNDSVLALAVVDGESGSGPILYAGGTFTSAGGTPAMQVAKWDGSLWTPLGTGVSGCLLFDRLHGFCVIEPGVQALALFDDELGGGPALHAAGGFTNPAIGIVRWDGSSWSGLGAGVDSSVHSILVFDDNSGSGSALYAGGRFSFADGLPASHIAKWNGTNWAPLGSGMNGPVNALAAFDDGSGDGPRLVAGGSFTVAGGAPANRIAAWDGATWLPLGGGLNGIVNVLSVFDDGSGDGPALYAGGSFTTADGITANRIAKWDGQSWSPMGAGTNGAVLALEVFDDMAGRGSALFAGGAFTVSHSADSFIAKWSCQSSPVTGDLNGDGVVDGIDLGILLANWSIPAGSPGCGGAVSCPSDINGDGVVDGLDLGILLANWTL